MSDTLLRPKGLDREMRQMVLDTVDNLKKQLLTGKKILELDKGEIFPEEIIRTMMGPEIGLQLLFIPEEYGGMGGGATDSCAVTRAMSGICLGISTAFFALQLGADPILVAGTPQQKEKWLEKIAQGSSLVAYAVTEPDAGSNLAAIKTKAEPVLDNEKITAYRINGSKQFISTGGYADFITVLANAPEGPTFFIVEKNTSGFVQGKSEEKHGIRASNTSPLTFSDVIVPVENLVGGVPGLGLKQANKVFGYTRLMVASMALGAMDHALSIVIPYAKERVQFKTPLCEKQGYTHKLVVPHAVRAEAAAAYIEHVAARYDSGENDIEVEGSIAKYFATEAGNKTADDAIQALGGYGYIHEYGVEKIKRDVKITCIYEGTSEIQQNIISVFRWKKTFKTKGGFFEDMALAMDGLENGEQIGAPHLARAARAVNAAVMAAHKNRLTKKQAVMFALADMITWVEIGCVFAKKASVLLAKGDLKAEKTAAMSRVFAADVCQIAANNGALVALSTKAMDNVASKSLLEQIGCDELMAARTNVFDDMDQISSYLFEG